MENVENIVSLGALLKERREELGMSLADLAREIQAPADFITALEEDNYKFFSAKIYALGFLKKILPVLQLPDQARMLQKFYSSWDEKKAAGANQDFLQRNQRKIILTPVRVGLLGGVVFFIFFMVLFSARLSGFILPPKLAVSEPRDEIMLDVPIVEARGTTEKESQLSVNGRELKIDESGRFREKIELLPGLNRLDFYVQNRFGKTNSAVRYVVVK